MYKINPLMFLSRYLYKRKIPLIHEGDAACFQLRYLHFMISQFYFSLPPFLPLSLLLFFPPSLPPSSPSSFFLLFLTKYSCSFISKLLKVVERLGSIVILAKFIGKCVKFLSNNNENNQQYSTNLEGKNTLKFFNDSLFYFIFLVLTAKNFIYLFISIYFLLVGG